MLFKILCQHSQIHTPKFKEPFFFNNSNYQNGIDWYANTYYDDIKNAVPFFKNSNTC